MVWMSPDVRYYYDWYDTPPVSAAHPSDGSIKAEVVERLRVNPHTRDDELRVDVKQGVVILQGTVRSRVAKRSAGDDCWDTFGVTDVSNQLAVSDTDAREDEQLQAGPEPVRAFMSTDVAALEAGSPLRSAAEVMRDEDVGSVVVTDGGRVTGIVTDRDIVIRAGAQGKDLTTTTVGSISTEDVLTVDGGDPVEDAIRLMRERAVRRVVVTDGDRPVGVVSLGDVARRRDPGSVLADVVAAPPTEGTG